MQRFHPASPTWARYAVAVITVGMAALLHLPMRDFFSGGADGTVPFFLFYPAVALTAALGGIGPGLVAVGLGAVVVDYLYLAPRYHFDLSDPGHNLRVGAFVAVGVFITLIVGSLRRGRMEAERALRAALTAEEFLHKKQEEYQAVLNASPVPILVTRGGAIVYANQACLKTFRYSAVAELRGRHGIDLVEPRHRPEVAERNRQRELGRHVPESYMTVGQRKDGSTFPCRLDVAKMDLADGPGTVAFVIDLSGIVVAGEERAASVAAAGNGDSVAAGVVVERV